MPDPIDPARTVTTPQDVAASAASDRDETAANGSRPAPAAPKFGPPAVTGEVGTLGPYRIVKQLGAGGMGAVYAALDTRLDRKLALKVMLPQFAADASAKERFLREACAAARIKHDNVVTVYEADERAGVPYIAMEFLEGYPLDEYLKKKGTPTIPQILRITAEAAAGLAAAHKIGLVHRDIKPGNLWLEAPNGRVKVLDFGLAKPVDAEVELTKSGAVVGTPAYMSPEQARGEKVDHRTDLFSLGSVLYRLCAGRLPFHGPTTMAVLMALGTEEPLPVREMNPAVPEPLAGLIHQLLAKRADARPQSAEEVMKRLRVIAQELAAPRNRSAELSTSQPQVMQPRVVYVPIQVTAAPPAENPFADLDASVTEAASRGSIESSTPAVPESKRGKPGGRGTWVAAGLALALAAITVAGVIIVIKNKDGTETKIDVPDGSTVTVKDKSGKTLAKVGPGGKQPVPDTSADRKAAEWVIAQGGWVCVTGVEKDIKAVPDLPKERFTLTLVWLAGTKVTDADLTHLKELKSLARLDLDGNTQVTDAGLAHLKELKSLIHLYLGNTQVSNAGLEHLKELKGLTYLNLQQTKVTAKELAALRAALPACTILHDGGTIEAVDVDRKAAEWVIAQGGIVHVNGQNRNIKAVAELPRERFKLTLASLHGIETPDAGLIHLKDLKNLVVLGLSFTKVKDAGLQHLKELKELSEIRLVGTQVSDAGLQHLKELRSLTLLSLDATKVSDAGLAHLKDLENLTRLGLNDTQVSDAGLQHLKDVKNLRSLYLNRTKVTAKGVVEFHAALPRCQIYHDGGDIEPKK